MTVKTQYLAELKDVLAIRLTCSKCSGSIVLPMSDQTHIQEKCPNCRESWLPADSIDLAILADFIKCCTALGNRKPEARCRIHLEMNAPNTKSSFEEGKF